MGVVLLAWVDAARAMARELKLGDGFEHCGVFIFAAVGALGVVDAVVTSWMVCVDEVEAGSG